MSIKSHIYTTLTFKTYNQSILRGVKYSIFTNPENIKTFQVEEFNKIWHDAFTNVPFYIDWKKKHNLPSKIIAVSELQNWPIVTKKELQENYHKLIRKGHKPTGFIKTGGSTGEPLHLPAWKDTITGSTMWIGRAGYNITPASKTFLIWGHHHLYGKGVKRFTNTRIRLLKDWISNIKRVSAYDLSFHVMKKHFDEYLKFEPELVIGFSASVISFVRINKNKQTELKNYPKAILCTAGPLSVNEKKEIETFFKAPVCMEYGSAECGVMAYTDPIKNDYYVFWDSHIIQGINGKYGDLKNIVTKLTKCYIPLIRYDIGDYIQVSKNEDLNSILRIENIIGRPSDIVHLNKTSFYGALIGDCVKQVDSVIAHQLHVYKNGIKILIVAIKKLDEHELTLIKKRLLGVVPDLKDNIIIITQVDQIEKTPGGKIKLVIKHESNLNN